MNCFSLLYRVYIVNLLVFRLTTAVFNFLTAYIFFFFAQNFFCPMISAYILSTRGRIFESFEVERSF